ncbi:hypothetical protein LR48_Vigan03g222100 [Vigna angularis]|uniref:RRM domain-containing protein n=1 Tax=Phaseolus angularis TaxID=3914 RepID=A0A0L9U8N0_PHAAN|nr:hypothetical protein LR48_Vigan03g222100 [Vigna angularis]
MEDLKKRKLDEAGNGDFASKEELRFLIEPLAKPQLVDLLAKLCVSYSQFHFFPSSTSFFFRHPLRAISFPMLFCYLFSLSSVEEIKSIASADPAHRKLFVRGLAWNTNSETLRAAFEEHGEIEEGAVIYDKVTGKSRGYGFITFKNMESTQQALRASSKLIDGRLAVCNLACEGLSGTSSAPDVSLRKLYIGSLSPEVTSELLLNYFARHGEIEEGSVAYDRDTNESRGFGFVTYKTAEAAKKAIDDLEKTLGGRNIIVKYADSNKGKTGQPPFPSGVVPMAGLPMTTGYMQPGKAHVSSGHPINYNYPQTVVPYSASPYPNPHIVPSPYPTQGQIPYPPLSAKKDQHGFPPTQPVGMNNYPYYYPKQ